MSSLILGALDAELSEHRESLSGRRDERWNGLTISTGLLAGCEVVLATTGVGKSMAALVTQHLIDVVSPERVIFAGIAGGLRPGLDVGDVVVAADSLQYDLDARAAGFELGRVPFSDYRFIPSDAALVAAALSFKAEGFRLVPGRVLTGDLFLSRSTESSYAHLVSELEGDAVEMEGASAGLAALVNGVPFLLIRVLSDRADGRAEVDFRSFLPVASHRTFLIVRHVLEESARAAAEG